MEIGGYFGLGFDKKYEQHKNCLKLNTGRNCFEYVLRARNVKKIYLPYYVCNQLLEPLIRLGIDFEFYSIDEKLDPMVKVTAQKDEAILFVNYFGLKQLSLKKLTKVHSRLIVDNTQAFFSKPFEGYDTFYSARKFFGVPDGAYLFTDTKLGLPLVRAISYQRMLHLLKRTDCGAQFGYDDFLANEKELEDAPIELMSNLTESL